jgi:hypothetical protein
MPCTCEAPEGEGRAGRRWRGGERGAGRLAGPAPGVQ